MKLCLLITILTLKLLLFCFSVYGYNLRTRYSKIKNLKLNRDSACSVTKEKLCCCYDQTKYFYWSTDANDKCFYAGINLNCDIETIKRTNDCYGRDTFCLFNEEEYLDFR